MPPSWDLQPASRRVVSMRFFAVLRPFLAYDELPFVLSVKTKGLEQSLITESELKSFVVRVQRVTKREATMNNFPLTVYIQNYSFIVRRCQVCVARHTQQTCIQMLSTDVWIWQMIHCNSIFPCFEWLINYGVLQIPGNVRTWPTYKINYGAGVIKVFRSSKAFSSLLSCFEVKIIWTKKFCAAHEKFHS